MIGRIWAIALNTFREAVRIRVLYGILVLLLGANLMSFVLGSMAATDSARVTSDVGLAGISLFGSLTAIFLGVFLLYSEIQRRTIHTIVSKPIERWEFVVGKYLGMALVLSVLVAAFSIVMFGILLLKDVAITQAIFFSSFSTPFLSGIFALALWAIGRVTPDIEAATSASSGAIRAITKLTLYIVPDLHLFTVSGSTVDGVAVSVHGEFVSWGYVGLSSLHALGWIAGLLAFAAVLFHRRDFV